MIKFLTILLVVTFISFRALNFFEFEITDKVFKYYLQTTQDYPKEIDGQLYVLDERHLTYWLRDTFWYALIAFCFVGWFKSVPYSEPSKKAYLIIGCVLSLGALFFWLLTGNKSIIQDIIYVLAIIFGLSIYLNGWLEYTFEPDNITEFNSKKNYFVVKPNDIFRIHVLAIIYSAFNLFSKKKINYPPFRVNLILDGEYYYVSNRLLKRKPFISYSMDAHYVEIKEYDKGKADGHINHKVGYVFGNCYDIYQDITGIDIKKELWKQ